jgi:L-amino acid N-acyltransferase YncA
MAVHVKRSSVKTNIKKISGYYNYSDVEQTTVKWEENTASPKERKYPRGEGGETNSQLYSVTVILQI